MTKPWLCRNANEAATAGEDDFEQNHLPESAAWRAIKEAGYVLTSTDVVY